MSCTVTNSWTRNKDFTIRQINARENRRSKTSGWAKTIIRLIKMKMQIEYERQRRILQRERRWDLNLERWVDLEWGVGDLGRIGIALPRPSESELSSIGSRSVMLVWTWRANGQLQLPKKDTEVRVGLTLQPVEKLGLVHFIRLVSGLNIFEGCFLMNLVLNITHLFFAWLNSYICFKMLYKFQDVTVWSLR